MGKFIFVQSLDCASWVLAESAYGQKTEAAEKTASWVGSVKEECLSKVILFGERSLRRALSDYVDHFHTERNH